MKTLPERSSILDIKLRKGTARNELDLKKSDGKNEIEEIDDNR